MDDPVKKKCPPHQLCPLYGFKSECLYFGTDDCPVWCLSRELKPKKESDLSDGISEYERGYADGAYDAWAMARKLLWGDILKGYRPRTL